MSAEPKDQDSVYIQIEEMRDLVRSPEWKHWLSFLRTRKDWLQEKVNSALRGEHFQDARIALALFDDCEKQVKLFMEVLNGLEKKKQGEQK